MKLVFRTANKFAGESHEERIESQKHRATLIHRGLGVESHEERIERAGRAHKGHTSLGLESHEERIESSKT